MVKIHGHSKYKNAAEVVGATSSKDTPVPSTVGEKGFLLWDCWTQVFAITGGAQAKVEDMSRALLSHVSQIPGKSFFQQVTSGGTNQPLADFGKKLAVSIDTYVPTISKQVSKS